MKYKDGDFFTVDKLSPRREKTPEGFLLCRDVPISRIGVFEYKPTETNIPGRNGKVLMSRTADELFNPKTMASFEGKPVVIGHAQFADPKNWQKISIGHVQNVRQGEGAQSDLLLADLLLQDERGIRLVETGQLTEVSCGYDAQGVDDGDGKGHQVGIVGNHVALVEKARCGQICKIGDGYMPNQTKSLKAAIRRFFKDGDEEGLNDTLDNVEIKAMDEDNETPVPTSDERIAALEASVKALIERVDNMSSAEQATDGDEDLADPACDTDVTDEDPEAEVVPEDEVSQVMADADELAPGIARPTGDGENGAFTRGLINRVKRSALKAGGVSQFGDSASLSGQALDIAFKAAVELARSKHNPTVRVADSAKGTSERLTNAQLNKNFKSYWEGK